jgi:serine/threonine protein kinase
MTPVDELLCGRYRIERMIGQGGMADVFHAVDVEDGEAVAIKLVRSSDPELARRFAQEAKALARLQHPGLVRLLDAGVHDGQAFLVMELVEGPNLAARLRRGPLSPLRTATLGRTLADALTYVHAQGIVHRDVKPANVLLGPGPRVRLADFGIARLSGTSTLTVTGTTLGTAGYMAPEQLEDHQVGPAADVWSLGVILLECLTGRRLFEGSAPEVVARRLSGAVPIPGGLPTPWHLLFVGMLAHDPAERLSAAHVAGLLAAEPFSEPWDPARAALDPPAPMTRTAPVARTVPVTRETPPWPPNGQRVEPATDGAVVTTGQGAPGTLVTPVADPRPDGAPRRRGGTKALWIAVAVIVLAGAGSAAWALSRPGTTPRRGGAHKPSAASTTSASTTTRPPPTTTSSSTTAPPTVSSASSDLVRDAEAGVSAGTISPDASKTLLDELNQTLSAASSGRQGQVSAAIGSMDSTIAGDVQAGTVTATEASTLVADVAQLATVLGTSDTATTAPTTAPGFGGSSTGTTGTGTTGNGNNSGNNRNGNGNGG